MAGTVVYTGLYTNKCLARNGEPFDTFLSVDFGSTYSSAFASASFGVAKLNLQLTGTLGLQAHETASYILSIQGIYSKDGTVLPIASGTFVAKSGATPGHWSGSSGTDGVAPYIKASLTGSIYDEATNLSAAGKKAYLWIKAV